MVQPTSQAVITWSEFSRNRIFLSHFAGIPAYTLHNFCAAIKWGKFYYGKTRSLFCIARFPFCQEEIFPSNILSKSKWDETVI